MDETRTNRYWSRPARELSEDILATFAATRPERARLHDMLFDGRDHGPHPDDALYMLNKSFADLVGIVRHTPDSVEARRDEFLRLLRDSPFRDASALRRWLRDEAKCEEVARYLERADHLRLLLLDAFLNADRPTVGERRSA